MSSAVLLNVMFCLMMEVMLLSIGLNSVLMMVKVSVVLIV